jgi:hypothetical protein
LRKHQLTHESAPLRGDAERRQSLQHATGLAQRASCYSTGQQFGQTTAPVLIAWLQHVVDQSLAVHADRFEVLPADRREFHQARQRHHQAFSV